MKNCKHPYLSHVSDGANVVCGDCGELILDMTQKLPETQPPTPAMNQDKETELVAYAFYADDQYHSIAFADKRVLSKLERGVKHFEETGSTDAKVVPLYTRPTPTDKAMLRITLEGKVREILYGIDCTETEVEEGWWETSTGAEFGGDKLNELLAFLKAQSN